MLSTSTSSVEVRAERSRAAKHRSGPRTDPCHRGAVRVGIAIATVVDRISVLQQQEARTHICVVKQHRTLTTPHHMAFTPRAWERTTGSMTLRLRMRPDIHQCRYRPILRVSLVMTTDVAFNSSCVSLIRFQAGENSLSKLIQQATKCRKHFRKGRRRHG